MVIDSQLSPPEADGLDGNACRAKISQVMEEWGP
jgi:hypothetical protein